MFGEHDHHHDHVDDCNRTHPADRAPQPDDPMEISGVRVDGDPRFMLDCLITEYARLGFEADDLLRMFDDPQFQGPHALTRALGRDYVRSQIHAVLRRCGVLRVRVVEQPLEETSEPAASSPVTLTVRGRPVAERI
jgi:hypothetical protein